MSGWFGGTALIDLVIAITVVEGLLLAGFHRITGKGVAPTDFAANLISGLLLMLAVRAALDGAWWGWTALCLLASGVVHATDLWRRWRN